MRWGPRAAVYVLAGMFALALAADLLWMPIQVSDSLGEILAAHESPSVWSSFTGTFGTTAYLRPLRIAQIKALHDLAQGEHYWLVYRGFHALLIVIAVFLFVRVLRISSTTDAAAAAFAAVVLVGLHTFRGTVRESFPINHFLEMVIACLAVLNLARSRGGILVDIGAIVIFIAAALTLESGLLVWVVAAAAWLVGWRGISIRGLIAMTACLAGYMYLRFAYLSTGVPQLTERSAGYGLDVLDPDEIQARFGDQPMRFYRYNVLASLMSVLFSEPQSGVFETVRAWMGGRPLTRWLIPVSTSLVTTSLIAWVAIRSMTSRRLDDTARFILVFAAVLVANAVLSFSYTKDEIVSPAGAFYALAAFAVMRELLTIIPAWPRAAQSLCVGLLCLLTIGWTFRSVGVHILLRSQAIKHQIDWVPLPYAWKRSNQWPKDTGEQALILKLRREAIEMSVPNTRVQEPEWPSRLWVDD